MLRTYPAIACFLFVTLGCSAATLDLTYSVAGDADNYGCQVALDAAGNIYLAGLANSTNFATVNAAFSSRPAANTPVFVRKLSPDGKTVLYSTYLGAAFYNATNHPIAMRVDSAGNLYLAANLSGNLPNGATGIDAGGSVALYKLSPAGSLVYATRLLPLPSSASVALAVDLGGNAYVGAGNGKLSVAKVDPTGTRKLVSFDLSVSNDSSGDLGGIGVGPDGSIFLAGSTASAGLTTTPGSYQPSFPTGVVSGTHGYLVRMKPDATGPIYSTYVAGQYSDTITSLVVDAAGNAFVGGLTISQGTSAGIAGSLLGFSSPRANTGFALKLDPTGAKALFTALLPVDGINALGLDGSGNLYAAGTNANGLTLSKVDPTGSKLLYHSTIASFIGLSVPTFGLTVDQSGAAYLTHSAFSAQEPDLSQVRKTVSRAMLVRMNPNPDQTDLSVEVSDGAAGISNVGYALRFTIRNNGLTDATAVTLSISRTSPASATCRVSGSGLCGSNTSLPRATFDMIPAGTSQVVEIDFNSTFPFDPITASAILTSLTSDPAQQNNFPTGAIPLVGGSFTLNASRPRAQCSLDGSPLSTCSPLVFSALAGTAVKVFWPSPQLEPISGSVYTFSGWSDKSTDNPRTLIAGATPASFTANFNVASGPALPATGVTNSASYGSAGVAPGELVTLFGLNLGRGGLPAIQNGKFPTTINDVSVTFDGYSAPLVYAGPTQVNAVVPYGIAGQSSTKITVTGAAGSTSVTAPVLTAAPGLFTANGSGTDQAAALNQDLSVNSPANPANPGDIIVLYGTGAGALNAPPPDGTINGTAPSTPQLPISVTIGGAPATVVYSSDAPGLVSGVIQINAEIPTGITYGHHVPVTWSAGDFRSPDGVTIAIKDSIVPSPVPVVPDDLSKSWIVSVSPNRIAADQGSKKITITSPGFPSGFPTDAVVTWNGKPMPTTFATPQRLQATISGASLEASGIGSVAVWDAGMTTQLTQSAQVMVYYPLQNNDLVYDSQRGYLYVAVAAAQRPQGSSIAALNPVTQQIERLLPLKAEPKVLAISDDYRYLYAATAGSIQRIDLNVWQADLTISTSSLSSSAATSMRGLPGADTTLAVVAGGSVAIFDGAQMRPTTYNRGSTLLDAPNASTIYGASFGDLFTYKISPSGITRSGQLSGWLPSSGNPVYSGGLVYSPLGVAFDPAGPSITATFASQGLMLPLPDAGQILILGGNPSPATLVSGGSPFLTLHNLSGGSAFWSLPIPANIGSATIVRWGRNGVALREDSSGIDLFQVSLQQ